MGCFATGVTVITVDYEGEVQGMTANAFSSVSLDPVLVLVCVDQKARTHSHLHARKRFGINVLSENQRELSERFARKGEDRFNDLAWVRGDTGVPLIPGVLAAIECEVEQRVTSGDHDILIGEMVASRVADGEPLIYYSGRYRGLSPL